MSFRLVDTGWDYLLTESIREYNSSAKIICPFIKKGVIDRLLKVGKPKSLQVITRFNLGDFYSGISDLASLRILLDNGAMIRGVRGLHAKLYLFGNYCTIVTSANLTDAALNHNQEFGFIAKDKNIFSACNQYFDNLWNRAGKNLTFERIEKWEAKIKYHQANCCPGGIPADLTDEGTDVGLPSGSNSRPIAINDAPQTFIKFFGIGRNRKARSEKIIDLVKESACYKVCAYPKNRRPRSVKDDAVMYMGWLVKDPNDVMIFGRAIGMSYQEERDDATEKDILKRKWIEHWPHFIRVHNAVFVSGNIDNGVSLNELMETLGSDAFITTQHNARKGKGNTDPRRAYRQQPAVALSKDAQSWLNDRFQELINQYGQIAPVDYAE